MNSTSVTPHLPVIDDWTFNGASTRELTHCFHDYPARMIPQVAGKLLDLFGKKARTLFDPYCGTGTSLVEGLIRGVTVFGTDLNPLARLIAQAKTTPASPEIVGMQIIDFQNATFFDGAENATPPTEIEGITDLDFWFKSDVTKQLAAILEYINKIEKPNVKRFFQVAFSETVRESSNTRNREFKLYRYAPEELKAFSPDVLNIMRKKLARNHQGLIDFCELTSTVTKKPKARIFDFNSVNDIPQKSVPASSVDIVVTSPPYGDSGTTVAYGQYSRLSAAWLGLSEPHSIDRRLMGGNVKNQLSNLPCAELNDALVKVAANHPARGAEVSAFYTDLYRSIQHVSLTIRKGGYACYVIGNRTVKKVQLPTHLAIRSFFEAAGLSYVDTFSRSIPNKRMPARNSPSNVAGDTVSTMTQEYIVVMTR